MAGGGAGHPDRTFDNNYYFNIEKRSVGKGESMAANIKELESRVEFVRKESTACQNEACSILESEADDLTLEIESAWLEGTISVEEEQELAEKLRVTYRHLSPDRNEDKGPFNG
jgi:hypothetical protein